MPNLYTLVSLTNTSEVNTDIAYGKTGALNLAGTKPWFLWVEPFESFGGKAR
jgi:hypothetical protein